MRECLRGYKLPEPTRLAHIYANEVKRRLGGKLLFERETDAWRHMREKLH